MTLPHHHEIAAVLANRGREDQLAEAIYRNTKMLEKLMAQLPHNTPDSSRFSQPRRHRRPVSGSLPTCWTCGQPGSALCFCNSSLADHIRAQLSDPCEMIQTVVFVNNWFQIVP